MDYPLFGIKMEVMMVYPTELRNSWRRSIKVFIVITDLCKKCQTSLLLMDDLSIVAMFIKLCIYGNNPASAWSTYAR